MQNASLNCCPSTELLPADAHRHGADRSTWHLQLEGAEAEGDGQGEMPEEAGHRGDHQAGRLVLGDPEQHHMAQVVKAASSCIK